MDNTLCCGFGSDAGCWFLPARHREPLRRGGRGYSILKGSYSYFSSIKYPVSSILPIVASMIVYSFWFKVLGSRFKVKKQILSLSQPGTLNFEP